MRRVGLLMIAGSSPEDKSTDRLVLLGVKLGNTIRDGRASRVRRRNDIFDDCRQPWSFGDWLPGLCGLPRDFGRLGLFGRLG